MTIVNFKKMFLSSVYLNRAVKISRNGRVRPEQVEHPERSERPEVFVNYDFVILN